MKTTLNTETAFNAKAQRRSAQSRNQTHAARLNAEGAEVLAKVAKQFTAAFLRANRRVLRVKTSSQNCAMVGERTAKAPRRKQESADLKDFRALVASLTPTPAGESARRCPAKQPDLT